VGFAVDKVALGLVFSEYFSSPANFHSSKCSTVIYHIGLVGNRTTHGTLSPERTLQNGIDEQSQLRKVPRENESPTHILCDCEAIACLRYVVMFSRITISLADRVSEVIKKFWEELIAYFP
jgi:hypothetical protein